MKFARTSYVILAIILTMALAGCGRDEASQPAVNYVILQSDSGDYIGGGQTYNYSQANAKLVVSAAGGHLTITIDGDQKWSGDFQVPGSFNQLQVGRYDSLQRYPFHDPAKGGLNWSGEGRGSNTLTGWFAIDSVTYENGVLTAIDLRFEQHSEGATPALHGQIHWKSSDATTPPGPVNPAPVGLWQPSAGSTPSIGNYIYLESEAGDYIGGGQTYTYTHSNAQITVGATEGHLSITVNGNEIWSGDFQAMNTLNLLQQGYYADLHRYPSHNPVKGGLDWSGEGRGSSTLTGWFAIDSVTYENGVLTAIDLRFEQHSEGATPALHGQIHWKSSDTTTPPGPVNPAPVGLWQPAAGSTPSIGNYIYLESEAGDYIGGGQTYTYTHSNAQITVGATEGHLSITVNGSEIWSGDFQTMNTLNLLQQGYYGDLHRYPFHNPVKGGLNWSGEGRGSNTLTGWFAIDSISYENGVLTAIDLRFEQHSEGATSALHGQIHWRLESQYPVLNPLIGQ